MFLEVEMQRCKKAETNETVQLVVVLNLPKSQRMQIDFSCLKERAE